MDYVLRVAESDVTSRLSTQTSRSSCLFQKFATAFPQFTKLEKVKRSHQGSGAENSPESDAWRMQRIEGAGHSSGGIPEHSSEEESGHSC